MGGYFSSVKKGDDVGGKAAAKGAAKGSPEDKRKSKYRVVYLDRDVRISEYPRDLGAFFVLRRTG